MSIMYPEEIEYFRIVLNLTERIIKICRNYSYDYDSISLNNIQQNDILYLHNLLDFKNQSLNLISSIHKELEDYKSNEIDQRNLDKLQTTINDLISNLC